MLLKFTSTVIISFTIWFLISLILFKGDISFGIGSLNQTMPFIIKFSIIFGLAHGIILFALMYFFGPTPIKNCLYSFLATQIVLIPLVIIAFLEPNKNSSGYHFTYPLTGVIASGLILYLIFSVVLIIPSLIIGTAVSGINKMSLP